MAISIQAGSIGNYIGALASASPFGKTLSVTVAAGSNSVLVLLLTNHTGPGLGTGRTVTFNGVAMTQLGVTTSDANSGGGIFYLVNPPVGTYNFFTGVSSWYGQQDAMTVFVLDGVDQATPFGTPVQGGTSNTASPLSVSITSPADGATLLEVIEYDKAGLAATAGQTELASMPTVVGTRYSNHSYKLGSSTSVGASWTGGNAQAAAMGVLVNAAAVSDTTAPTLTSPTGTQTGATTASGTVTTDEANGTLYWLCNTSATATLAAVKAGSSVAVSSTGSKSVTVTGLTASTAYYLHYAHTDAAANDSAVVNSAQFTTAAATVKGVAVTLYNGAALQASLTGIRALWWDAIDPSGAPTYSTAAASTNASGVLTLDLNATTADAIGDYGFLLLYKVNATINDSLVFAGQVAISNVA